MSSSRRLPPHVDAFVKHYELIRQLGEGGMGDVFLARDTKLGRLVAIKFLRQDAHQSIERFLSEARMTARCRHENIVVVYEVDELRGSPYMVLEYLEGKTLRDWMDERRRRAASAASSLKQARSGHVSSSLVIDLVLPVVRALAYAHRLGIVHRDLKPENILLTDTGSIKVLDFGIAKHVATEELSKLTAGAPLGVGSTKTEDGAIVGTLPYISPEQWLSEAADHRGDLWAMGIILFEL